MTEILNCTSCGAANQLPKGITTMYCAYCGSKVEKEKIIQNSLPKEYIENPLKVKPEISKRKTERTRDQEMYFDSNDNIRFKEGDEYEITTDDGGELSLIDRGINSLQEIICWFSDNELKEVVTLDLSNNKIKDLKGIERFKNLQFLNLSHNLIEDTKYLSNINFQNNIRRINLSNNKIEIINGLQLLTNGERGEIDCTEFNFSNNENLQEISNSVIENLNAKNYNRFPLSFKFENCNKINFESLKKLNFNRFSSVQIFVSNNDYLSTSLKEIGFQFINNRWNFLREKTVLEKTDLKCKKCGKKINNERIYNQQNGYCAKCKNFCFIATATMGSYDHPEVMILRNFRDKWILKRSWGNSFVKWYYKYGYIAAKKIEKNYFLKKLCYLTIVKPLVLISKLFK
jgi:hypothetical protein